MKRSSLISGPTLLPIVAAFVLAVSASSGVHADERDSYILSAPSSNDISDEIGPADSPAIRDTDDKGGDKSIKERLHMKEGTSMTRGQDNSRYRTDGTERYEQQKDNSGTGSKREGRD
ncbi:hypothetical protein SAMN05216412_10551 [Nitrosospira multiformis]|uniref:Uncharacterized protein n=1 Tax=Nitrosospira multiformis TaxID=1231 RepID=A0A1I0DLD8_9PROT|nr:hypothetical protein [Nitrosospira multiformis]SET33325.1 hypothetical protein SAMN05216412_10551 [Nitrosospira multiformis]